MVNKSLIVQATRQSLVRRQEESIADTDLHISVVNVSRSEIMQSWRARIQRE